MTPEILINRVNKQNKAHKSENEIYRLAQNGFTYKQIRNETISPNDHIIHFHKKIPR